MDRQTDEGDVMRKLTGLLVALLTFCALLTGLAPATASSQAEAAISAAYNRPGVAAGLGWATGPVSCGLKNGGCYQSYQKGAIVWSPATGAQPVLGGIRQVWGQYKFEDGPLGYPTGPETCGLNGNGCRQNFQNGYIAWSPSNGGWATMSAIGNAWLRSNLEDGPLGYPAGAEICGLKNGGCYQMFQSGTIIWSPATGAQPVLGGMRQVWGQYKFEDGPLGYPTGPETCGLKGNGCRQNFQGGAVLWSPTAGGWPTWYAIKTAWEGTGAQNGQLGYPTGAESCNAGQCRQNFQGGYILWTANTGANIYYSALVVNKKRPLSPIDYVPWPIQNIGSVQMQGTAADAANAMIAAAASDGVRLLTVSGYRDYWTQRGLYSDYVNRYGQSQADLISARPGYSEHQTGLALDIGDTNTGCDLQTCFENTAAGTWARNNAWRFGFIIRYPWGQTPTTGYSYEPWHLRYVGTPTASDMRNRGIPTLEQYYGLPAAPDY